MGIDAPRLAVAAQSAAADFQRAQAFLQAFLEGASDAHEFAHTLFICVLSVGSACGNFSKLAGPTPTGLRHSARRCRCEPHRREAVALGGGGKKKITLKELCQGGGGWGATLSGLMNWWGRFPRVGVPRRAGADRQPWADGFESRWDSGMERRLIAKTIFPVEEKFPIPRPSVKITVSINKDRFDMSFATSPPHAIKSYFIWL